MSQHSQNKLVHETCRAGLELLIRNGLLYHQQHSTAEAVMNQHSHLGLLPPSDVMETKVDGASALPHLLSSWKGHESIQFDEEGYVTWLDLGGKRLHRGFPCSIQQIFCKMTKLTTLNLAGTDLPLEDIFEILKSTNIDLKTLFLGGNGLGDVGATAFAKNYLPRAKSLRKLDLRYNEIGEPGMTALCDFLFECSTVRYLYLEGNRIGDDGVRVLSDLLRRQSLMKIDSGLLEIFLGSNQIQSHGAKYLANALYENKLVSKLYLEGNNIGLDGASAFASVLEDLEGNTSLKSLFVDNNNIGKEASKRLAKALKSATVIEDSIA